MTKEQRAELRRLEQAATAGLWKIGPINYADIYDSTGDVVALATKDEDVSIFNGTFIAAARNAIPGLLDALDAAEARAEALAAKAKREGAIEALTDLLPFGASPDNVSLSYVRARIAQLKEAANGR